MAETDILDALGNLGDFVGGIAVVFTLVYLAVQVRQNTRAVNATSRQHVVDGYRTINRLLLDPSVARAFARGIRGLSELSFEDRSTAGAVFNEHALFFQGAFALYESGQLEEETYRAYLEWIATVLASPGGSAWWEAARPVYADRVVQALDERLSRGGLADLRELDPYRLDATPFVPGGAEDGGAGAAPGDR